MSYEFEKKKLYAYLGKNLVSDLKGKKCYIAGGTITSLFSKREINDIDIYFKSEKALIDVVTDIWEDRTGWIVSTTNKATLIKYDGKTDVQIIHFKYFPTAEDIFRTFDFTVCMGAFDFETEEFILHEDFMQHNSQRILKFNKNTAFPIVSLLRIQKYKEKGYDISKPEYTRIALTCMDLKIDTYEDLKEQMGGMYGVNYDKLFTELEGKVDLGIAIDKIENLCLDDDYFNMPDICKREFGNVYEYLDEITIEEIEYIKIDEKIFRISNNKLRSSTKIPKNGIQIDHSEYFKDKKYYKYVKKVGDKFFSFHDSAFEYTVGEEVKARGWHYNQSDPVLYFTYLDEISSSHYCGNEGSVLIEAYIQNSEDFDDEDEGTITLKKCTMIREVPEEEYKQYL